MRSKQTAFIVMKFLFASHLFFATLASVSALPEYLLGRIGNWKDLHDRNFSEWAIITCSYRGTAADGGSHVFKFSTSTDVEFHILIACAEILTDEERESRKQVFYLLDDSDDGDQKYFKIAIQSKEEKMVIKMLSAALAGGKVMPGEETEMLKKLIYHLNNRKIF